MNDKNYCIGCKGIPKITHIGASSRLICSKHWCFSLRREDDPISKEEQEFMDMQIPGWGAGQSDPK